MRYIHQHSGWPQFHWQAEALTGLLADIRHRQGRLLGRMEHLGLSLRDEASLRSLTEDVVKSSAIEGELLNDSQVRSSIGRRLGIDVGALSPLDRHIEGIVEMTLDATQNYSAPLTAERLFGWHAALFPTGRSGTRRIAVGAFRPAANDPMQVVSGPLGHERVHFEAPAADRLPVEVERFLDWFNGPVGTDPVLKAAIAHLWFVTIHPFEDGNGRIARVIADMALARSEQSAQRFYSMSAQIRVERKRYYDTLEATQKGSLDITSWLLWFLACLGRAFDGSEGIISATLDKARFWEAHGDVTFNPRQRGMLSRLLDGFEGKLTSSKWAQIAKCSQDTALRDIESLIAHGILCKDAAGGRSTSYSLADGSTRSVVNP